jgi:hypothetical protein
MAEEPQEQRDNRAAGKQQFNGKIRASVARDLNQSVHDGSSIEGTATNLALRDHPVSEARPVHVVMY